MEEWRDIIGYEGLYQVSNLGGVRRNNRIMKMQRNGRYLSINLCKDGVKKKHYVHRLVALVFCDWYAKGLEVNHKDENTLNNRADNLEWVTGLENNRYSHLQEKLTLKKMKIVQKFDLNGKLIEEYRSVRECCRINGFTLSRITLLCRGEGSTAYGFKWKYKDG